MFTKTYSGDTFRNLIRQYSFDRMGRDAAYKADVYAAIEKRKAAQLVEKDSK